MITCSEDFSDIQVTEVTTLTPERGFSSVKFLPGTGETVVVALKSVEDSKLDLQGACKSNVYS